MAVDLNKFSALARALSHVKMFAQGPPKPPYGKKPTVAPVLKAVTAGESALPLLYRMRYAEPLKEQLPGAMTSPDPRTRLAGDALETITGAVYQHAANVPVAQPLNRFLAVISNLYRSFLDETKRAKINLPAVETVPPLAVFQSNGQQGPFTNPVDGMQQEFDIDVGVVSLPSAMRDQPILWASLAHEVGGHDVLHADDGLLEEIARKLKQHFGGGTIHSGGTITLSQLLSLIWPWWVDEAASDIYGLLNIGPTFALNLAFFFASFRAPKGGLKPNDPPRLETDSGFQLDDPAKALDVHPTDILRLSLAIGAIQSLTALSQSTRSAYISDLRQLITLCGAGAQSVRLVGNVFTDNSHATPVQVEVPIAPMQAAAEAAGSLMVTSAFQTLGGHGIQEIETWDDADEATARHAAQLMGAGQSAVGAGDDAHLLAGATLAALDAPDKYAAVSALLNAALDDSFARDSIWHPLRPDPLAIRRFSLDGQWPASIGPIARVAV
jgi:hypothetical protein